MNIALSVYPLSSDYKASLNRRFSSVDYLTLIEWRQRRFADLWRRLREIRAEKILIPIEDAQSVAHLPILSCVAAASRGKRIELLYDPEARGREITRGAAGVSMLAAASESLRGLLCLAACRMELKRLLSKERIEATRRELRRAIYVNPNLWFGVKAGGSVGHVAGVANGFAQEGIEVKYLAASPNRLLDSSVACVPLDPPRAFALPYDLNRFCFHRYVTRVAGQLMCRERFGFVYQRHALGNYSGVVLSRRYKVPFILEYNSSEVWIARHWGDAPAFQNTFSDAEKTCLQHAHLVVTVSRALRDELLDFGVPEERIVWYPNCIDPRVHDPARIAPKQIRDVRAKHDIPPDALVIGFLGTFGPWHGAEVLARAIEELAEKHSEFLLAGKVRFLLVGDGPKMQDVRAILEGRACQKFAALTGLIPQEESPAYLAACDVLVSPHVRNADGSCFFGSPTKLFEYMAMGKAIVASRLDQIGDVLAPSLAAPNLPAGDAAGSESELAVLCAPGDTDELIRGLLFMMKRPAWRALLGRNARKEALSKYTWDRHTSAILSRLKEMRLAEM